MELNQLKAFLLVAQKGGLVGAANRLKLTPSGISLRIKKLEREIWHIPVQPQTKQINTDGTRTSFLNSREAHFG
jgi:hypothetical protein